MILDYPANLYTLSYKERKTYLFAFLFIVGNIALPQLCHLAPGGGLTWLPIYFFTLIAAYKYGIRVGLLTAILSPIANNLLFGMPAAPMLPIILIKSVLLASVAAYIAHRTSKISLLSLLVVILAYQVIGTTIEWIMVQDFYIAVQDFRMGIPGMLVQLFGGYAILRWMAKL